MAKNIKHAKLDQILDRLAQNPDTFAAECEKLAARFDKDNSDLEITDPRTWHKDQPIPRDLGRRSIEHQLRAEIDDIIHIDREEEARLARRIEFARIRLHAALEKAGMQPSDLDTGVHYDPSAVLAGGRFDCGLPPRLCRRWSELHALRTEMVERNLYLVLINVERYAHTSAGRLDLIQEGSAALFRAVDGFDWKRGLLFRTYAVHWLNQAFRSYLYNFGHTVRVPVYLQKAMKHINLAIARLRDPNASAEAIAKESGLGVNVVETALTAARSTHSMDATFNSDDDAGNLREVLSIGDGDPYTTDLEDNSLEDGIQGALDQLSDRERFVISLRFGLGSENEHTLAEVAAKLGVSLERVRQIQVRAITKMRTPKLRRQVDPFLN
ncbi:MAG: sigma-70 family RNA polymerase sigma factor [Planctomycetes bacterium]|nr:sigma-70 family RNA polymerase sigma factor [Planctomycetota bacterium]